MAELAFRQIHLDFHTSPLIPEVGANFDAAEFASTLAEADVNSVTIFAKCHHGMSYYPTEVGVVHPSLERDLLGEMIAACHARRIRTPVYISVVWDEHAAREHPEWQQVSMYGVAGVVQPFVASWKYLCMNSPYLDYVAAQTEELVRGYEVDGVFFDIVFQVPPGCICKYCLDGMIGEGLDPQNEEDLLRYSALVSRRAMERLSELVREHRSEASIFFNGRVRLSDSSFSGLREELPCMTHVEIESLPSGEWGYLHYPLFSRYVQTLGTEYLGMTARFHKSWADFGGLKNRAALEYEVFSMLATGAKCSIGDQLHPRGELEQPAYDLIGDVYSSVKAKESWCTDAHPETEIGVLVTVAGWDRQADVTPEEGVTRMLLEAQRQFQLIDREADLAKYPLIILPDRATVDEDMAGRLRDYVASGGKLLISGSSGLAGDGFTIRDLVGASYSGMPDYTTHYIQDEGRLGLPEMPHVMYEQALLVEPEGSTEVLARIVAPYFDRAWNHFSSHRQTPPAQATAWPAVIANNGVIYISSPIFTAYRRHGNRVYRQLVEACLDILLPQRLIRAAIPTSGQVTLMRQADRLVAHVLYYVAERRTPDIDIIEDVVTLPDVKLEVFTGRKPRRAYLAPQEMHVNWGYNDGVATCMIPELQGHQMVVFEL